MKKTIVSIIVSSIAIFSSCNQGAKVNNDETTTRGNIKIGVDESYQLLLDTEILTFTSTYNYAHIEPIYKPELEIRDLFLSDSIRTMVTCRQLSQSEIDFLTSKQIIARTTKVAHDAIAFIINKNNPDSLITFNEIKNIFSGKVDNWNQINNKSESSKIKVVFDNDKSGNIQYFIDKFGLSNKFPEYFSSVNRNEEVVSYVEGHENAIGIVSVNWISDRQDSISHSFLSKIKVVAVSNEIEPDGGGNYYRPYQGSVADKSYPFIRDVFIICRETFPGLGTGFSSFFAGEIGQRIILKSGMVPATMPIRLVMIKDKY